MSNNNINKTGDAGSFFRLAHSVMRVPEFSGCFGTGRTITHLKSPVAHNVKGSHGLVPNWTASYNSLTKHDVVNRTSDFPKVLNAEFGKELGGRIAEDLSRNPAKRKLTKGSLVWKAFSGLGQDLTHAVSLTSRTVVHVKDASVEAMKHRCQQAKDYVYSNKAQFAKMAFSCLTSYWIEEMLIASAQVQGAVIPIAHVRIFAYVVTEFLWCAFQGRRPSPTEVDRIAIGILQYPVFNLVVDNMLGSFVDNMSAAIIFQPLKGLTIGDVTPSNIFSYLAYAGKHGLDFGIEKAKVVAVKFGLKKAIEKGVEKAKQASPKSRLVQG